MAAISAKPVITTIIPTYRRPALLRRAILSALHQTYPHVRVCVYDNASGDDTESVVKEIAQHDPRVKYHRHPRNIGSYNNFNYGIREVETDYFSLLSDDDVLAPTFYEQAMRACEKYPEAMFACMATMVVDTDLRVISGPIHVDELIFYPPGAAVEGMLENAIPGTWTGIVYRREVRDGIGLIDTTVGPHADGGFVYHAAARYAGVAVPGVAAVLMAHEESVSGTSLPVSGVWIAWWDAMMRAIYEDNLVPSETRKYVRERPRPDFLLIGLKQVARALARGNYQYASRAAQGIRECGYPVAGRCLGALSVVCSAAPISYLLKMFRTMRQWRLGHRRDMLHKKYGYLVEFIGQYGRNNSNVISRN